MSNFVTKVIKLGQLHKKKITKPNYQIIRYWRMKIKKNQFKKWLKNNMSQPVLILQTCD